MVEILISLSIDRRVPGVVSPRRWIPVVVTERVLR